MPQPFRKNKNLCVDTIVKFLTCSGAAQFASFSRFVDNLKHIEPTANNYWRHADVKLVFETEFSAGEEASPHAASLCASPAGA